MAPSPSPDHPGPNTAFRRIRGDLSPGEFSAAVRRAAREIGERVSCDARYIGRVESGEIRCPNYAYERVFKHMFPGYSLAELGFAPRDTVRGRRAREARRSVPAGGSTPGPEVDEFGGRDEHTHSDEESDVLRRAFMTSGPAAALAATLPRGSASAAPRRVGGSEVQTVEEAVRQIRLLDDKHGADGLYQRAGHWLRNAYAMLEDGAYSQPVADRLHASSGELAISVGWLAHDSGRHGEARSHYAEALATARMAGDPALEAHAFCNTSFLARDDNRPREAVLAAQAAQQAAARLGSARLLSLLALREAGGWAGLGDRGACERALLRAQRLYGHGAADCDPEWMTFYGEAEMAGLEAQCWSRLGDYRRAAAHARRGVALQDPHFTRNIALYSAELAGDLAAGGEPDESAKAGCRALELLGERVKSSRIQGMLDVAARALRPYRRRSAVGAFFNGYVAKHAV
ncbi:tetratricopeptide repeat protein [Streptantibioticus ferralitis]|uniref:Tetratricopeptide repeat protein n=1 Tax=Streptantibioticus ferralitis TaxID=236510 RepID=A0ABT5YV95_9ACTN|nr:tetratricopeptide repeat protein [Streptantibioticus ferralitis]MDF2255393.1 tetratricopeptide repeat protein [Streptantibioticus ferralitis]